MKKVIVSILIIIIFLANLTQFVYADDESSWVQDAFSAASNFMNDTEVSDELGIVSPLFEKFKSIVKAANVILLVLLMGLSIIALAITGVRYIASGASPNQKEVAKQSLHTIFIGMAIGFGAYVIWRIAMSLVEIIIAALAES